MAPVAQEATPDPIEKADTTKDVEAQIRELAQTLSPKQLETLAGIFTAEQAKKEEVGTIGMQAVEKELFVPTVPANDNYEPEPTEPLVAGAGGDEPPQEPPNGNLEVTLEAPKAPEIPPQTEVPVNHPAFENLPKEKELDTSRHASHGILGRTWARVERFGIKVASAPKWAGLETMRQLRNERAAKAELAVNAAQEQVKALEAKLASRVADQQARIAKMGGGFFDRMAAAKLEREKDAVVVQVEKAKEKLKAAQAAFEFKKGKETYWNERLTQQSNKIAIGVEEKLAPSKAEFEVQSAKHKEVSESLEKLSKDIDAIQSDILSFEIRLKQKPEAAEKVEIKNGLKTAKEKLAELKKSHADMGKQKSAAFAKVNRAKLYLSGWDGLRNAA